MRNLLRLPITPESWRISALTACETLLTTNFADPTLLSAIVNLPTCGAEVPIRHLTRFIELHRELETRFLNFIEATLVETPCP
jgi:hypothetical protein